MFCEFDEQMMLRAIALAKKGRFTTHPNPNVGCVIVKGAQVIGEGFHQKAGSPHAEVNAINQALENHHSLFDSTVYVTLEPCSHFGKTPPCADALLSANVSRVVCAMVDPNPQVAGKGIERLRAAGITVDVGLCQKEAERLNPGFIKMMKEGKPYVQTKIAASLDGRSALANGQSQWITGTQARQDVQVFRAQSGAILSTAQTVLDDNAKLNVRWESLPCSIQTMYPLESVRQPCRVILDSQGRLPPSLALFDIESDILIFTHNPDLCFDASHVEIVHLVADTPQFNLQEIFGHLASRGINHVWVEAGATLSGTLFEAALIDELILYQAPTFMGQDSRSLLNFSGLTDMQQLERWRIDDISLLDQDVRFRLFPPTE